MDRPAFEIASAEYRALGLIQNPFLPTTDTEGLEDPAQVACHAESGRLLSVLDREADAEKARPLWITKAEQIPDYYTRIPLSEVLGVSGENRGMNVLIAYVPFFMMRSGRIRSALNMVAERIAGNEFGLTVAAYAAAVLSDPDPALLASTGLSREEATELAARFISDPAETAEEVFGSEEPTRVGGPDTDAVVKGSAARIGELEVDPDTADEESDALAVEAPDDAPEIEEPEPVVEPPHLVYLREYAAVHLSPVIARALKAYTDAGVYALGQELKISRGPRKTLAALGRFATYRFRKVVIVYDQFDAWFNAPAELRANIAGALAEIRMLLGKTGVLAFLAASQELEEIRDQFMGAHQIEWTVAPLLEEEDAELGFAPSLVEFALKGASISGDVPEALADLMQAVEPGDAYLNRLGLEVDRRAALTAE